MRNLKYIEETGSTGFQTFAVFWMFHSFFWVFPRYLNFMCRRFGTLCQFHIRRWCKQDSSWSHHLWRWNGQCVPKRRHIKFRRRGITQKKECNDIPYAFLFSHVQAVGLIRPDIRSQRVHLKSHNSTKLGVSFLTVSGMRT